MWVADSFSGFREDLQSEDLAEIDFLAVSLDEVRANFARFGLESGVEFVQGYFEHTLAQLEPQRWAICRLDGDSYEATRTSLRALYPELSVGGYLIVDDYHVLDECRRAVDEFRAEHGIDEPMERVDWTCARWRRRSSDRVDPGEITPAAAPGPEHAAHRPRHTPVPTVEELELRRENAELKAQLAAGSAGSLAAPAIAQRVASKRSKSETASGSRAITRRRARRATGSSRLFERE